jgi:hypothetical protein
MDVDDDAEGAGAPGAAAAAAPAAAASAASAAAAAAPAPAATAAIGSGLTTTDSFEAEAVPMALRCFQGVVHEAPKTLADIATSFHQKRTRESRFIEIDGHTVLKANNYTVTGREYVFNDGAEGSAGGASAAAAASAAPKRSSKRQVAGRDYHHEMHCLHCWDYGKILMCDHCPASFHPKCLGYSEKEAAKIKNWSCPHHECTECHRKSAAVGGLLFRCECCSKAYCEDHLPWDADLLGQCERYAALGFRHPDQACYIHCSAPCVAWAKYAADAKAKEAGEDGGVVVDGPEGSPAKKGKGPGRGRKRAAEPAGVSGGMTDMGPVHTGAGEAPVPVVGAPSASGAGKRPRRGR